MKEKPILFSGPMMRANLAGTKDVTRRILKNPEWYGCPTGDCSHQTQYECDQAMNDPAILRTCRYGSPGDVLWAREKARVSSCMTGENPWYCIEYAAGGSRMVNDTMPGKWFPSVRRNADGTPRWCPAIHMPRWACRFTAKIVSVRIERLQEITEADAIREGVKSRAEYAALWDSINGKGSWASTPWVWRIEYRNPHKEYA